ncbi:unnamed protein product [Mytilus coruscus]|uniref:CCHC-type domain-containing protein n=1 Tax=Mytilus coruscus TaxID=42192 RepID=A0A6J8CDS9_MYTCO|nr:unnamed protein product [Mytilus coruscus]
MIDFESSPTRENAGAGHPSIPVVDRDRQSTPIFSPLCVETHVDRDAPLRRECSDPDMNISEAYGDTPYFRLIPVHQQEENKQKIADMCNFGNKVSNWIEEHHANRDTTHTGSYEAKPHLKSIEQPDFRQTISPIAMQSVPESEIEKVSGEIESLLDELGHLSDVSCRDSLTPSPRTNMVVQHQHQQQNFAGSLQRQPVLDLSTHSHDIRQHFKVENQQEPPVANFQQIDQQVINRPQPVNNSPQQDTIPLTTDKMPSNHVLHFPSSVQHDNVYRQQDQQVASHLQQASPAYHRDIYKPYTPTVERVQPFPPPIQHDDYHRQPEFNKHVHQTFGIRSPPPISNKLVEHQQPIHHGSTTNGTISDLCTESSAGTQTTSDWFHQPTTKCQQGSTTDVASSKRCAIATTGTGPTPTASPASTWGQQLCTTYTTTQSSYCAGFLPQQQPHQQQPFYQQPGYQPPNFVPRTQPPIMIGHPTSMFQPPRGGPPQTPTQSFNQQNMPRAPRAHNNQPSERRKEYNSDYHERQRRRDPGRNYTADSDTSDVSPYRQTRNKRRSEPAYLSDHSHKDFSPIRSARTSLAHSRHSPRRSLTARESQSESETDSRHSRRIYGVTSLVQEKSVRQGTSASSRSPNQDNRSSNYLPRRNYGRGRDRGNNSGDRRQNQRGYNNDCYYCHKPGHYKRNCPDLRQNNNRQQSKQLTPKKNHKDERRVEFDDDNFIQDN